MSQNQGESRSLGRSGKPHDAPNDLPKDRYNIIIISRNLYIHQALDKTLQHFSLNGRGIRIFNAGDLREARDLAVKNPDIILVVIDNDVQVNGSYSMFVDYIRKTLGNRNCCITFKENLIKSTTCPKDETRAKDSEYDKFYNARERLIDVTRMVMMTTEMETKINNRNSHGVALDPIISETSDEGGWLTKEKLNTVMAHDLKEPLGNIKVMLDFLTNEPDLLDKETSKDLLLRVRESANNIHELLEDYLFWSRMFRQEIYFNPHKIDLGQLARENVVLLKSTAASKNITLKSTVAEKMFAFADEYMITTVIRNLVYNAIKFTSQGGSITISGQQSEDMVEIRVADNGMGISVDNIEKLFKTDIYLSTSGTDKEKGFGLGLVLCKDFIEKNGGTITVESQENKGSTMIFTLPAWSFAEHT